MVVVNDDKSKNTFAHLVLGKVVVGGKKGRYHATSVVEDTTTLGYNAT